MRMYLIPVMGMCFAVDGLLLLGTDRLMGKSANGGSILLAAGLGATYGGACLLPEMAFLGGLVWRMAALAAMGTVAFGNLRRTAAFAVLNMAAGGLSLALGSEKTALLSAVIVCLLCRITLRRDRGEGGYLPVVLEWNGRKEHITALRDTGNTLRDPISGEQVLVVSAYVADRLFGLSPQQLATPLETMIKHHLPGMRLIPYRSVGGQGMLLGVSMNNVRIGQKTGRAVVAFAPSGLDGNNSFQALTGGRV